MKCTISKFLLTTIILSIMIPLSAMYNVDIIEKAGMLKKSREALIIRLKKSRGDGDVDGMPSKKQLKKSHATGDIDDKPPVPTLPRRGSSLGKITMLPSPKSPRFGGAKTLRGVFLHAAT